MTRSLRTIVLLALSSALLALLAAAQPAQAAPAVTVGGRPFPGGGSPGTAYSCTFQIGLAGFAAGQRVNVEFRAAPPTVARQGDPVVLTDTFFLESSSRTTAYSLREPLLERFQTGSLAGWDVDLTITVTEGGTTVFTGRDRFLVAGDCIVPLAPTTTTTSTTSTTVVVSCMPQPCGSPPPAFLGGAQGEVAGEQGSYCWSAGGGFPAACVDSGFLNPSAVLKVTPGEQLRLRFAAIEQPLEVLVYPHLGRTSPFQPVFGVDPVVLSPSNPAAYRADLPEGTAWLVVATRWRQGSSIAFFKVQVAAMPTAPLATATPAAVSFAG